VAVDPDGFIWTTQEYGGSQKVDPDTGAISDELYFFNQNALKVIPDAAGDFYIMHPFFGSPTTVDKYGPESEFSDAEGGVGKLAPYRHTVTRNWAQDVAVDRSNNHVYVLEEFNKVTEYGPDGAPITSFGQAEGAYAGLQEGQTLAVNSSTHDVYVLTHDATPGVDVFRQGTPITVPDTTTTAPDIAPTSATLRGQLNPDGIATTDCRFEWGTTSAYENGTIPCSEGPAHTGSTPIEVSVAVSGLETGTTYHYRLAATNASGVYSYGADRPFQASSPPALEEPVVVNEVNTDSVRLNLQIDPHGGDTTYWVEYGADDCAASTCLKVPLDGRQLGSNLGAQQVSVKVEGLAPATRYHFRVIAQNEAGTDTTGDQFFITYPTNPSGADPCPNAQVRQQTGASLLLDCRAYELVSAANAGGYDVESNAVPGQEPLPAYPEAAGKALYSLHFGAIPGIAGSPTNFGRDPYVATRGGEGWTTRYVGIPATAGGGISDPFGSPLGGADDDLSTFAFAGESVCHPCFPDGSTGIPVRLPDGSLVQGMAGSLDPGAGAEPAGLIRQMVSADGRHLVFGSTSEFEPEGNGNGDVALYERDLVAGQTEVVSTTPGGATMTGDGIGELDVSADGSRVLFGQFVGNDAAGDDLYHLYMHFAGSAASADVTPGGGTAVLFDGMTRDGRTVFFTSRQSLAASDGDTSADIYKAQVDGPGEVEVSLVSAGSEGTGDTDACDPVGAPDWNSGGGPGLCDTVAFAGGGGLAVDAGTFYFLSPELLDGNANGSDGDANLYVVAPGAGPRYVATLEDENPAIQHAVHQAAVRDTADFQVTPDGAFAAFASTRSLTGFINRDFSEVFRFDIDGGELLCVSCAPTNAASTADDFLTSGGRNLADDGRVFFTSREGLVLRDTNELADAYEWTGEAVQLVSTGASTTDATLLSVSADGTDAFFFTRETLVPLDRNGNAMKVYDARAGGGFLFIPNLKPCAASDECHGPGTPIAPQPPINTVTGQGQPVTRSAGGKKCKRGFVKRKGKCVRKHRKQRRKQRGDSHRG
jgi:hypothetical protein